MVQVSLPRARKRRGMQNRHEVSRLTLPRGLEVGSPVDSQRGGRDRPRLPLPICLQVNRAA